MSANLQSRDFLQRQIANGRSDLAVFIGLAIVCAKEGDRHAALDAVNRALAEQPRNVQALIIKADQLAALGDARAASSFYRAAVDNAPAAHEMPAELRDEVARAGSMCERYAAEFEAFLRSRVAVKPSSRFAQSLDIMAGRKHVYFQEPRQYFFPGLPQLQFYDRAYFPWLEPLEAATADIRGELVTVLEQDAAAFQPYVQRNSRLPHTDAQGLLDNPAWSAFYLWKHGEAVPGNQARCPKTVAALADVPFAWVKNRSPSVLFSVLRPGAHIPPHTGEVNTRLICHLPLVVPAGVPATCYLRVGNETRAVVQGQAWVFDDTIEHEAWNGSDQTRVILLFEIWRPELNMEERAQVSAMFEAIDSYG
jgi:aspartyl/asparaginyl beta-hydroxylase (cupin superfamily)